MLLLKYIQTVLILHRQTGIFRLTIEMVGFQVIGLNVVILDIAIFLGHKYPTVISI